MPDETSTAKAAADELVAQAQELDMGYETPTAPEVTDEVAIKVTWRLAQVTNRWIATGPLGFRFSETACDAPLPDAVRRLKEAISSEV